MRKIRFEPTFNAGNVMQIAGAIIAITFAWTDLKYDVIALKARAIRNADAIYDIQNKDLYEIRKTQASLAENMAILTTIIKERTKKDF